VLDDKALYTHPFFETKKRTIETYYNASTEHSSSTANELLQGVIRWPASCTGARSSPRRCRRW
jgi:hypothetical protein